MNHEQSAPIMTAKPAEYQPVPTVDRNAQYPTIVAAPPYRANLTTFTDNGPRPNNFIMLTVITLFCCMGWPALFCSVIAIIYSMQVDLAWDVGHQSGARKASNNAKNWAIGAIITGVLTAIAIGTLYGVLYAIGVNAATSGTNSYNSNGYRY